MLKNKLVKRFLLIISAIFIIFMIWIFPTNDSNVTTLNNKITTEKNILYLLDRNNYLSRVDIIMQEKELDKKIIKMLNYLTLDSNESHYLKKDFKGIIPKNTKLLSYDIKEDLIVLNFSKEFLNISEEDESNIISSIIYTFTSLDGINKVSIYVDGNLLEKLPYSGIKIEPVLDRTFGINTKYNISNLKGNQKVTIYYLNKTEEDYYYYTPITYVESNDNEKMEIIISEMASKSTYQTGLISYIKAAKNIDYKINSDILELSIKKELFNSLNNSNLIESVIYSMNLMIKDNYDVKEVIYLVDDSIYRNYYLWDSQ